MYGHYRPINRFWYQSCCRDRFLAGHDVRLCQVACCNMFANRRCQAKVLLQEATAQAVIVSLLMRCKEACFRQQDDELLQFDVHVVEGFAVVTSGACFAVGSCS